MEERGVEREVVKQRGVNCLWGIARGSVRGSVSGRGGGRGRGGKEVLQ